MDGDPRAYLSGRGRERRGVRSAARFQCGSSAALSSTTPPPFSALVIYDRDRLGREQIETSYIVKQFVQRGVRVFETKGEGREITLDSPTDKIILSVTAFANELERQSARNRTYDAMAARAKVGHVTGGVLYGYNNVEKRSADNSKRLHVERAINEDEAAVVHRVFERCAQGAGFRRITHELNLAGCPAPRPSKAGPRGWCPSTVRAIVSREIYKGELVWNKTKKRDVWGRKRATDRPADAWLRLPMDCLGRDMGRRA